jgi:hypothetical protein
MHTLFLNELFGKLGVAVVRGKLLKWSHTFVEPLSGGKNPHIMVRTGGGVEEE